MNKKIIIAVFLLAAAAAVAWFFIAPNEKAKVKKQFASLSDLVSKEKGETNISMALRANSIGNLFDDKCSFDFAKHDMEGIYTPEEITSHAARGRAMFSKISLKFYDINPEIENDNAMVDTTVRFYGEMKNSSKVYEDTREIQCKLKKVEGKWKFSEFKVVEVLKK